MIKRFLVIYSAVFMALSSILISLLSAGVIQPGNLYIHSYWETMIASIIALSISLPLNLVVLIGSCVYRKGMLITNIVFCCFGIADGIAPMVMGDWALGSLMLSSYVLLLIASSKGLKNKIRKHREKAFMERQVGGFIGGNGSKKQSIPYYAYGAVPAPMVPYNHSYNNYPRIQGMPGVAGVGAMPGMPGMAGIGMNGGMQTHGMGMSAHGIFNYPQMPNQMPIPTWNTNSAPIPLMASQMNPMTSVNPMASTPSMASVNPMTSMNSIASVNSMASMNPIASNKNESTIETIPIQEPTNPIAPMTNEDQLIPVSTN